jgi:hypothetical protein
MDHNSILWSSCRAQEQQMNEAPLASSFLFVSAQQLETSVHMNNAVPMRLAESAPVPPANGTKDAVKKDNDLLKGKGLFTTDTPS